MGKRFRDFDKFWEEQKKEPVVVKICGKTHELPAYFPAKHSLKIAKMRKEGEITVPEDEVITMLEDMFGAKSVEKWIYEEEMGIEQLQHIIEWVTEQYFGKGSEEGNSPEEESK